jgi:hypothetical protein
MPLRLQCPSCRKDCNVPDHLLGKAIACPACGQRIHVVAAPSPQPAPPPLAIPIERIDEVEVMREPFRKSRPASRQEEQRPICTGCGRRCYNRMNCDQCRKPFCSEVCIRRHAKHTNHEVFPYDWASAIGKMAAWIMAVSIMFGLCCCLPIHLIASKSPPGKPTLLKEDQPAAAADPPENKPAPLDGPPINSKAPARKKK